MKFHKVPSPLAGEGQGEGDQKHGAHLSPPPLPSPVKGEGDQSAIHEFMLL